MSLYNKDEIDYAEKEDRELSPKEKSAAGSGKIVVGEKRGAGHGRRPRRSGDSGLGLGLKPWAIARREGERVRSKVCEDWQRDCGVEIADPMTPTRKTPGEQANQVQ